jgi:hypothetical protein
MEMFDIFDLDGLQGIEGDLVPVDIESDSTINGFSLGTPGDLTPDTFLFQSAGNGLFDILNPTQSIIHTGESFFDTFADGFTVDAEGGGFVDSFNINVIEDMDGQLEVNSIFNGESFSLTDAVTELQGMWDNWQFFYDLDNIQTFDPSLYDPAYIIGNPAEAMQVFYPQRAEASCAVVSQGFVIHELTGVQLPEDHLRYIADAYSWYMPGGGTFDHNIGNLLLEHGLTVNRSYNNTLSDISDILENSGSVLVTVNSKDLHAGDWHTPSYAPGIDTSDHVVQVIGINTADPRNPLVIVNDPGVTNGGGAMIPINTFMSAWGAGNYFIVSAFA